MPRAEVGSIKHLSNQMKAKGLQRLRYWCQACEKQARDANGFKQHCLSESHNRNMALVAENPQKVIENYSRDFQNEFLSLLRTAHGEKAVNANRFYQEVIRHKEHTHMNSTKWPSLTEFVKYLGREGIVTVREDEKDGMMIAWRDTSAAATKRREEIRELELAEARSGANEDKLFKKMARRAQEEADEKARILEARKAASGSAPAKSDSAPPSAEGQSPSAPPDVQKDGGDVANTDVTSKTNDGEISEASTAAPTAPVKISFGLKTKAALPPTQVKKTQSVFKRARAEKGNEEKPKKKVKL
ncbi:unnamed protein product [Periconia digitata]|uniref:DNA/RNA-binding protein Kin17 WH-like domain-containing protein n=1 Tax=Periconia digitata TaxID=1303443 RepID=A0A9W4XGG5_9PLEO|nr:unnamed protein product [Periconia digitata]